MKNFNSVVVVARNEVKAQLAKQRELRAALPKAQVILRRIGRLPSSGDIRLASVGRSYDEDYAAKVDLFLSPSAKASSIVREVVREFHVKATKAPLYHGESLSAQFSFDGILVVIYGYKPDTCKIVETVEEEAVDIARVDLATGKAYRNVTKRRVVCDPEEV